MSFKDGIERDDRRNIKLYSRDIVTIFEITIWNEYVKAGFGKYYHNS